MVARSPDERRAATPYEQAGRAIHRLVHEDGSWSGHEHNRFYLNLGDGSFVDASSVAGLDFVDDGRAFVTLDFEGDGDLDLVLNNRSSPQVRLLRNDYAGGDKRAVAFHLVGNPQTGSPAGDFRTSRDAVGARVTLRTDQRQRVKYVQAGSGFVSESSRRLYFGLEPGETIEEAEVVWPSGRQQRFTGVPTDHLIELREGEHEWKAKHFRTREEPLPAGVRSAQPLNQEPAPALRQNWLVEPVPAPALQGRGLAGEAFELTALRGRPVLVNFWATWCAPCQKELSHWKKNYERLQAAGADYVAVSVDEPGTEDVVREYAEEHGLPFPVVLPDADSVHAYNMLHRELYIRHRDLEIPTTFLIDGEGRVVKLYRGVVEAEQVLQDLAQAPQTPAERLRAALPYAGSRIRQPFGQDYLALGTAFAHAGIDREAQRYLELGVGRAPGDIRAVINLAVLRARMGQLPQAIELLERTAAHKPGNEQVLLNLGVAYLESGALAQAKKTLERVVALDPYLVQAHFNLGLVYERLGEASKAETALRRAVELNPNDAEAHDQLGMLYATQGRFEEALASFERATELAPGKPDAQRHLGMAYFEKGFYRLAAEHLERSLEQDPDSMKTAMVLALAYYQLGRFDAARPLLEKILAADPDQPQARRLLERLDRLQGAHRP